MCQSNANTHSTSCLLFYVFRAEVKDQFALNDTGVIDEDRRMSNLRVNGKTIVRILKICLTCSTIILETASTSSHFDTSHL